MTADILEAMRAALAGHTWTADAPASLVKGPIPPGSLAYPAIGIMADNGDESGRGRAYADTNESFSWTLADFLEPSDLEAEYLALINWRDEARVIARDAVNGMWGLGAVQATRVIGWVTDFFEIPGASGVRHLASITIKLEVEYREQI